jgi:hypothetical protein
MENAKQPDASAVRDSLIQRAKSQLKEIEQYFYDVEHWNATRTRFEQIEPDPDGEMTKLRFELIKMIGGA